MGALVVVVEDADADPPVSGGAGEAEDVGRVIAAFEVIGEFGGGGFVGESTDLDGPFSGRGGRCGGLHQLDFHFRDAGLPDVEFLGGGEGEIDDSSGNEGTAIGDADERSRARFDVRHAHDRAERESAVGGGHGMHVVDFAVGAAAVVVGRTVPAGESGLGGDGPGIGGERRLSEVGFGAGFFTVLGDCFGGRDVCGRGLRRLGG